MKTSKKINWITRTIKHKYEQSGYKNERNNILQESK